MKPDKATSEQDSTKQKDTADAGQVPDEPDAEAVDARSHPDKLKENRDRLGVDEEHKTPDMKKQRRGTFP